MKDTILVTGAAGFIGFHLCRKLLEQDFSIVGIDNLNNYYDPKLKTSRLKEIENNIKNSKNWNFIKCELENKSRLFEIFRQYQPKIVINLAAQAGVRYSIKNPSEYLNSNIVGFGNILEACKTFSIENLVFASSSSVYGGNKKIPFEESDQVNHPVSMYAATKRSNELMAHVYSHLYKLPTTGLRFFTVYGPWGRPDMSYFIFTSKIVKGEVIKIYNDGDMLRDFTYVDDVIDGIFQCIKKPASNNHIYDFANQDPSTSWSPFQLFNIGNSRPINLMRFINIIEDHLGIEAKKEFLPMQPGDVERTSAKIDKIKNFAGFKPKINLEEGIPKFLDWYKDYYM